MFGAEDTHRRVVLPQRNIEHGADAVRLQVALEKFTGARVGAGVGRRNHSLVFERVEVGGCDLAGQHGA